MEVVPRSRIYLCHLLRNAFSNPTTNVYMCSNGTHLQNDRPVSHSYVLRGMWLYDDPDEPADVYKVAVLAGCYPGDDEEIWAKTFEQARHSIISDPICEGIVKLDELRYMMILRLIPRKLMVTFMAGKYSELYPKYFLDSINYDKAIRETPNLEYYLYPLYHKYRKDHLMAARCLRFHIERRYGVTLADEDIPKPILECDAPPIKREEVLRYSNLDVYSKIACGRF
ncbi:MAG: hypothetical protein KatS3mg054_0015 [Chloroflexus sp.]|nr:MAG: hypothetical protein KatS3mg054_0015 [Chloroflexus sp.]